MDLREEKNTGSAQSQEQETGAAKGMKHDLFVARDNTFEDEEGVEAYGVYLRSSENTLVGLFWDKEIANHFMKSVESSDLINKLKKVAKE